MTTNISNASSCKGFKILISQRNEYNYYNAPPARIETISPYPANTPSDLNMRRKAEILQYKNNSQNTKTNNLTKKQNYALLSRGIVNELSQYTISSLNNPILQPYYYGYNPVNMAGLIPIGTRVSVTGYGYLLKSFNVAGKIYSTQIQYSHYGSLGTIYGVVNDDINHPVYSVLYTNSTTDDVSGENITPILLNTPPCDTNETVYKWSTESDVPGSPILLHIDPSIPLYNYINNVQSSYGSTVSMDTSLLKLFTTNELDYVLETLQMMKSGDEVIPNNDSYFPQIRNSPIGVIILTDNMPPSVQTFNISIPIGIWFIGSFGYGRLNIEKYPDISNNYNNNPYFFPHIDASSGVYKDYHDECYSKEPGKFLSSDVINLHAINNSTKFNITYSGVPVKDTSYTLQSSFTDVSFTPYGHPNGHFYGIQYIGNINITNLQLSVQALETYDLNIQQEYTYNYDLAGKFDYFQTGLFFNLSTTNQSSCQGITFKSKPSTPFIQSSFASFTPGSNIPYHTPYILKDDISYKAFPSYIKFTNLNGNFQTLNIKRVSNIISDPPQTYYNIAGNSFVDRFLYPSDISFGKIYSYTYTFTPVYNHMFGTTLTVGPIQTTELTISGGIILSGITSNSIPLTNIHGTFTHYSIQRDISMNSIFVKDNTINNLTNSYYTDISLISGAIYRYTLIPYFSDPYNYTISGRSYIIPDSYTTHHVYMDTVYDIITPTYVSLRILQGKYDTFTVIRDGIPSKIYYDVNPSNMQYLSRDPSGVLLFTDIYSGLIPGNSYTYSTIPTRSGIDGKRVFLTSPLKYRSTDSINFLIKIAIPTIYITAKLGTITPNYVQIVDISGLYTSFSIIRTDANVKVIDLSGVYSQYTDTSNLIPGNNYKYSLLPSFKTYPEYIVGGILPTYQNTNGSAFVLPNMVYVPYPPVNLWSVGL
jgi:hypothetical protein